MADAGRVELTLLGQVDAILKDLGKLDLGTG